MKTIELLLITNSDKLQNHLMSTFSVEDPVKVRNWQGGSQKISETLTVMIHSFYYSTDSSALWDLSIKKMMGALFVFDLGSQNPWQEVLPLVTGWRNTLDIPIILGVEKYGSEPVKEVIERFPLAKSLPVFTLEINQPETYKIFWKNSFKYFTDSWKKDIDIT